MIEVLAKVRGVVVQKQYGGLNSYSSFPEKVIVVGQRDGCFLVMVRVMRLGVFIGSKLSFGLLRGWVLSAFLAMVRLIRLGILRFSLEAASTDPNEARLVLLPRQQDGAV